MDTVQETNFEKPEVRQEYKWARKDVFLSGLEVEKLKVEGKSKILLSLS